MKSKSAYVYCSAAFYENKKKIFQKSESPEPEHLCYIDYDREGKMTLVTLYMNIRIVSYLARKVGLRPPLQSQLSRSSYNLSAGLQIWAR
jgi:hypothetical protein